MNRDSLLIDLRDLRIEMRGISPKVSTYAKMQEREKGLLEKLGGEPVVERQEAKQNIFCIEKGCENLGQTKGHRLSGPRRRYLFCAHHRRLNVKALR